MTLVGNTIRAVSATGGVLLGQSFGHRPIEDLAVVGLVAGAALIAEFMGQKDCE